MSQYRIVAALPDLISPDDYAADPKGQRVRLRIAITAEGVEILGDAVRPAGLESLLEALEAEFIEQMLCG